MPADGIGHRERLPAPVTAASGTKIGFGRFCFVYTNRLYSGMFEWDEEKRLRIIDQRGLDFRDAAQIFGGRASGNTRRVMAQ